MMKSSYDWETEKLSDTQLSSHFQDIEYCSTLTSQTLLCESCGLRLKVDTQLSGVKYCVCSSKHCLRQQDGWEPYVERKDILVWRKEHQCKKGLYHYKLYGKFDDVNVWEFLAVQLDLSKYRLGWDTTTSQCREVDTQTLASTAPGDNDNGNSVVSTQHQNKSQAMVYYWEVQYPAFFSNRDYCCLRQYLTDPRGHVVVSNRTTHHHQCPVTKKNWRVEDYQSVMAVRPTLHPDKPGVEFSVTAFEDPGVALPDTIINWVAVRAMPEFMTNLRAACLKLRGGVGNSGLLNPDMFRKEALKKGMTMLDVDNNESSDVDDELMISKGDASYESAWIDKLLGITDDDDDQDDVDGDEGGNQRQSRHNSYHPDPTRQGLAACSPELPDGADEENRNIFQERNKIFLPVSNKTEADKEELDELDLMDEENNKVQREIYESFIASRNSNNHKHNQRGPQQSDISQPQPSSHNQSQVSSQNPLNNKNDYFEYEMELILFEENNISQQLQILEHKIREDEGNEGEEDLLNSWLEFISKKNVIFHRRLMLEILQNEQDLERKFELIQTELRKTHQDPEKEELLLKELLHLVDLRDKVLSEKNAEENILCQEENIGREIQQQLQSDVQKQKCCIQ